MAFDVSYVFKAIDQFSGVAKKIKQSLEGVRSKTKDVSVQVKRTGKAFVANFKHKASRAIDFVKNKLTGLDRKFKSVGKSVSSFGRELLTKVSVPLIALGGIALVQSAKMESLQISFETMLRSADKAKKLVSDLEKFTATTPFKMQGVAQSAKTLLAFGVSSENMIKTLRMLGDVAAGTDKPIAEIAQIFGKVRVKGKMMTEELLQLSERGVPIIADLAKQYKLTSDEIFEQASKSNITFKVMQDSLIRMTSQGGIFFDQTRRQAESLGGRFSTLVDNLIAVAAAIGDVLVSVFGIKDGMAGLSAKLADLPDKIKLFAAENPAMAKFLAITVGVVAVLGPLLIGLGLLVAIMPLVGAGFSIMFGPIGLAVMAIAALAFVVYKNFGSIKSFVSKTIDYLANKFPKLTSAFKTFDLRREIDVVIDKFEKLKAKVKNFDSGKAIDDVTDKVKLLIAELKKSDIGVATAETGEDFKKMWGSIFAFWKAGWSLMGTQASITWDKIKSDAPGVLDKIKNSLIDPLLVAFEPVTEYLTDMFSPMEFSFSGAIESWIKTIGGIADSIGSMLDGATEKINALNEELSNKTKTKEKEGNFISDYFGLKNATVLKVVESNGTLTNPKSASSFGEDANQSSKPASSFGEDANQSSKPGGLKVSSNTEAPRVKIEVAIKDQSGRAVSSTSTLISGDAELNTGKNLVGMA